MSKRKVHLTHHAVDAAKKKFKAFQDLDHDAIMHVLLGAAGSAEPSKVEHVVQEQGFLEGQVFFRGNAPFPVVFSYAMSETEPDTYVIITCLTPAQLLGHGGVRHGD
jgi:hypothetical protein